MTIKGTTTLLSFLRQAIFKTHNNMTRSYHQQAQPSASVEIPFAEPSIVKTSDVTVDSLSSLQKPIASIETGNSIETKLSSLTKPLEGKVDSFDHVTFWVGNAKQSAVFYMTQFGFKPFAFRGMETGSRDVACHVLKLNDFVVQFVSAIQPNNKDLNDFLMSHGDSVKDVAFRVDNIEDMLKHALEAGAELVHPLELVTFKPSGGDANTGSVRDTQCILKRATIKTFGDVTHTFIERNYDYATDKFLPDYSKPSLEMPAAFAKLPSMRILSADHIVGQFPPSQLDEIADWYSRVLNFNKFWSVDEKQIFTEHSGVKSHVVTNHNERVKMPLCEVKLSKSAHSKAEEFVRFNNGSGIHHIALLTDDIVSVVANMRARGMDFLNTPDTYYDQLKERLKDCPIKIGQDIETLRKLKILVDFDEQGYLLQIFTRPVQDRPTLVFEFIQRFNHDGFGAGNFLALFKAIEAETKLRNNL